MNDTYKHPDPKDIITDANLNNDTDAADNPRKPHHRNIFLKILKYTGITVGCIIVLCIAAVVGVTLWLTPTRLANLINEYSGKYVDADVHLHAVDYSIWSTFPYVAVKIDSLTITSKSLDGVSESVKSRLPDNYKHLVYMKSMEGKLNILSIIKKNLKLKDVALYHGDANIVMVNDTTVNFNIIHKDVMKKLSGFKLSGFSLNSARIDDFDMSFFSLAPQTNLYASAKSLTMEKIADRKDEYTLSADLSVDRLAANMPILHDFPVKLNGDIRLPSNFKEIGIPAADVIAGNIDTSLALKVDMSSNNPVIDKFYFQINPFEVNKLMDYLSPEVRESLAGVNIALAPAIKGKLLAPFNSAKDKIPAMELSVNAENGNVDYTDPSGSKLTISDISILANMLIDPAKADDSRIELNNLSLACEGFTLNAKALVTDLLSGSPFVESNLQCKGNINKIASLPMIKSYNLKGNIDNKTSLSLRLNNLKSLEASDIKVNTDTKLLNFSLRPANNMALNTENLNLSLDGSAAGISAAGMNGALLDLDISAAKASVKSGVFTATTTGISINGKTDNPLTMVFDKAPSMFPGVNVNLGVKSATVKTSNGNLNVAVNNIASDLNMDSSAGKARFCLSNLFMREGGTQLITQGVAVNATISEAPNEIILTDNYPAPRYSGDTKVAMDKFRHSPRNIVVNIPEMLSGLLTSYNVKLNGSVKSGAVQTPAFPSDNSFKNIVFNTDLDTFTLKNLWAHSAGCGVTLNGKISNIRNFIAGRQPERLKVDMNLNLDSLDINHLAWVYEQGVAATQGIAATLPAAKPLPDAGDSTAALIPSNLDIVLNAKANHLLYTDVDISDISTLINVKDGNASLDNLKLHTPYAAANVSVTYATADINDMYLSLDADISDINLENLYDYYKNTLFKDMPYLATLSGDLSATTDMKISLFPTMYLDVPSLHGKLHFASDDLNLHQNAFIKRFSRFLFLHDKEDIHFANLDVNATVHDNLIELIPFDFDFDRYRFTIGGTNNLDGDMFYHLGVDHSPIPFPFGINIKGQFSHPQIRFGGHRLKPSDTAKVDAIIMEDKQVNLSNELMYGMQEFLKTAAKGYHPRKEENPAIQAYYPRKEE